MTHSLLPKVIILAAGEGQRLRPYTNHSPKCLVPYKGKPLLDWTLETLHHSGLKDIVIVGGHCGDALQSRASRLYYNPNYQSTNMVESLFCADDELHGDVIVSYGDITYRPEVMYKLLESKFPFSVIIDQEWKRLWEQRMEDPLSDVETLILSDDKKILELGLKPTSLDHIHGQYIGLFKISGAVINKVRDFYWSLDRNGTYRSRSFHQMYMTTFLQLIIDSLMPIHAVTIHGGWIEIDTPQDLTSTMIE